jgi:hypothetical protein
MLHSFINAFLGRHEHGSGCGHNHGHGHKGCSHGHHHAAPTALDTVWDIGGKAFLIGHGIFTVLNVAELIKLFLHKARIIDIIHQEVISICACMQAAALIGTLIKQLPLAAAALDIDILPALLDNHRELIEQSVNEDFADTGNNHVRVYSRVGPTLATYLLHWDKKDTIQRIMRAVGAVDALLSTSTLLSEPNSSYSFATYLPGIEPYVEMVDFVHPQLIGHAGVHNSIILGRNADQPTKLIITGPNKAGKSSITKAITVNLVLAQSLTIAAATKMLFTPMNRIITYINIHDNLADNASMFYAEMVRTSQSLQELTQLEGKVPAFALFDDSLCRSTQPEEGELAAYRFIKKICNLQSTIALVVTHFEQLTSLEEEFAGSVRNCHVGLTQDQQGRVISTYNLVPGISARNTIFSLLAGEGLQTDILHH